MGSHPVTVIYSGDSNNAGSTATAVNQVVNPDSTHAESHRLEYGAGGRPMVTLRAAVTVLSPGTGKPTGSVTFYDGATTLDTATLTGGVATLRGSPQPAVGHGQGGLLGQCYDGHDVSSGVSVSVGLRHVPGRAYPHNDEPAAVVGQVGVTLRAMVLCGCWRGLGAPTGW